MGGKSKDFRTRPSFLVETNKKYLLDIGPDARIQLANRDLSNLDAIFITHSHYDHMAGLGELHAFIEFSLGHKLTIYCSGAVKDAINGSFGYLPLEVVVVDPGKTIEIAGATVTPFSVQHIGQNNDDESLGFIFEDQTGTKWAYMGDYHHIGDKSLALLQDADFVIADGTYLMKEAFHGSPYADAFKELDDSSHIQGKEILEYTSKLPVAKVYFHSISHMHGLTHDELQAKLPDNHFATYDGMSVDI